MGIIILSGIKIIILTRRCYEYDLNLLTDNVYRDTMVVLTGISTTDGDELAYDLQSTSRRHRKEA